MIITIKTKEITAYGRKEQLKIRLIIGWHWPNLSLRVGDRMIINNTIINCLINLMTNYCLKDHKCDLKTSKIIELQKTLKKQNK